MRDTTRDFGGSGAGSIPGLWMNAWFGPWRAWQAWNSVVNDQWRLWLRQFASLPAPWMPALARERDERVPEIDYFLPWLPRVEALVQPLDAEHESDALRVMLRAMMPRFGSNPAAEWLRVDAVVQRSHGAGMEVPSEPLITAPDALPLPDVSVAGAEEGVVEEKTVEQPAAGTEAPARPARTKAVAPAAEKSTEDAAIKPPPAVRTARRRSKAEPPAGD